MFCDQAESAAEAHRGLEEPKKFTNLRVKKDKYLENQKYYSGSK